MSPVSPATCTHDLGPGTTICLRCRQEQRYAARLRQRQMLARVVFGGAALVVIGAGVTSIAGALRSATVRTGAAKAERQEVVFLQQGNPTPVPSAERPHIAPLPIAASTLRPPLQIAVREGQTQHPDSIIVERTGDSVVVDFDTEMGRTRRRDKFERTVRATLPIVYGARIESTLAALPDGAFTAGGDLLTELPLRGVRVPVGDGWQVEVWPETRPGRDGPLVVGYWTRLRR